MPRIVLILMVAVSVSGCATAMVTGAVVGTAVTATSLAVKGTVGAGKLAYKGTKAIVTGTANMMQDDDKDAQESAARRDHPAE